MSDNNQIVELRKNVESLKPQLAAALPAHIDPDRFARVVMTAAQLSPELVKAERRSLLGACMKAAQDGLLPDGREAAFVLFWDKNINGHRAQYMPMVAGILKKVRNSGELRSISANVVYEKDSFNYELGDDERIEHVPYIGTDRGRPIAAYAIATLTSGEKVREVMTREEVYAVRNISRAKDSGPWSGPFETEMWRKTVIRRLAKRLPMSSDLDAVIKRDDDLYDLNKAHRANPTAPGVSRSDQVLGLLGSPQTVVAGPDEVEAEVEPPKRRGRKPKAKAATDAPDDGERIEVDPETGEIRNWDDEGQDDLPL